ncbi:uncharacterized protein LOC123330947 isoform X2 [Bubalus bubalis]|uniref:uncharacterized protein LOC123330947 isoform X2 n=1 Tax=Bubalus bubalis TaxID=89462 RepID=UPI001D110979|nr:uncharacterized protein LOC123330947 isoform X2 [Bubalus bubalis]
MQLLKKRTPKPLPLPPSPKSKQRLKDPFPSSLLNTAKRLDLINKIVCRCLNKCHSKDSNLSFKARSSRPLQATPARTWEGRLKLHVLEKETASYHVKGAYYQHDSSLLMLTLMIWVR